MIYSGDCMRLIVYSVNTLWDVLSDRRPLPTKFGANCDRGRPFDVSRGSANRYTRMSMFVHIYEQYAVEKNNAEMFNIIQHVFSLNESRYFVYNNH